ncbi:MAG: 3-methyl-2-oxobutanoate hydroxymethyltransferase [Bradymonadia bacterium]
MALTIADLHKKKAAGEKISMITTYDATFARLVEKAGIDMILIGDSLGNVIQGRPNTLAVTVEDVIYHSQCVMRGCSTPFVVTDMPFGSYQTSDEDGVRAGIRILKEGGTHAVKIEGGARVVPLVTRLVQAGVPVMGHLGLTPQSVNTLSGYHVQGKGGEADVIASDALALQRAGCFSLVLECVPRALAKRIQDSLDIPVIGIGAGPDCAGQVLVLQDALGLSASAPKFVRKFASIAELSTNALRDYAQAVRDGSFPADTESYH